MREKIVVFFYLALTALLVPGGNVFSAVYIPEKIVADSCIDSDGGIDYYAKGTVDTKDYGSTVHYNDLCFNGGDQLHEWYCKGMQPAEAIKYCEDGCQDGACLRQDAKKPDLVVDSIRIVPDDPDINERVCIYAAIKNIGNEDVASRTLSAWTYINSSYVSSTFYDKTLGAGEYVEKEVLCSKYGENIAFRKGLNQVRVEIDPNVINKINESDETNNKMNSSFNISENTISSRPDDWDVAVRFDVANKGPIYPFRGIPGVVGETYYDKLNGTDDVYRETAYANTCPSYWDADPVAKRALGWYAQRKRMDNGDYKILIKGTAPADCGYSSPGESRGELTVNPDSGWKIKEVVKCNAQGSNKGQEVKCESGEGYIAFSAGSNCGGCCACADSGSLDIEVILGKNGLSPVKPQGSCMETDGGQNLFEKGETTYMGFANSDQCASQDTLKEYYCDKDGKGKAADYVCESGCENGACVENINSVTDGVNDQSADIGPLARFEEEIRNSGLSDAVIAISGVVLSIIIIAAFALSKKM